MNNRSLRDGCANEHRDRNGWEFTNPPPNVLCCHYCRSVNSSCNKLCLIPFAYVSSCWYSTYHLYTYFFLGNFPFFPICWLNFFDFTFIWVVLFLEILHFFSVAFLLPSFVRSFVTFIEDLMCRSTVKSNLPENIREYLFDIFP